MDFSDHLYERSLWTMATEEIPTLNVTSLLKNLNIDESIIQKFEGIKSTEIKVKKLHKIVNKLKNQKITKSFTNSKKNYQNQTN